MPTNYRLISPVQTSRNLWPVNLSKAAHERYETSSTKKASRWTDQMGPTYVLLHRDLSCCTCSVQCSSLLLTTIRGALDQIQTRPSNQQAPSQPFCLFSLEFNASSLLLLQTLYSCSSCTAAYVSFSSSACSSFSGGADCENWTFQSGTDYKEVSRNLVVMLPQRRGARSNGREKFHAQRTEETQECLSFLLLPVR